MLAVSYLDSSRANRAELKQQGMDGSFRSLSCADPSVLARLVTETGFDGGFVEDGDWMVRYVVLCAEGGDLNLFDDERGGARSQRDSGSVKPVVLARIVNFSTNEPYPSLVSRFPRKENNLY